MGRLDKYEKIFITDLSDQVDVKEIKLFFDLLRLKKFDQITQERYASLFLKSMLIEFLCGQDIEFITDELYALEGIQGFESHTKSANELGGNLSGLMHKHYFSNLPQSYHMNMKMAFKRKNINLKFDQIRQEIILKKRFIEILDLDTFKNIRNVFEWLLTERFKPESLTGEWIVYKEHEGKRVYLAIQRHEGVVARDQLKKVIKNYCELEFPYLQID